MSSLSYLFFVGALLYSRGFVGPPRSRGAPSFGAQPALHVMERLRSRQPATFVPLNILGTVTPAGTGSLILASQAEVVHVSV